jgi:hypothetical protein
LLIGCAAGCVALWNKKRELLYLFIFSLVMWFGLAIFKINPRYVRYSLPVFPILYILFSIGFLETLKWLTKYLKSPHKKILALILAVLIFGIFPLYEKKFVFWPQTYYSINADMRENPIVDYKTAFVKIDALIGDRADVIVMDAWNDRVPWYLPGQKFVFLIRDGVGIDPVYGAKRMGTIQKFEAEKLKHPAGIVIVENWQSQTPQELQDHIRKTLKYEFEQATIKGNEADPWNINVYSWGL